MAPRLPTRSHRGGPRGRLLLGQRLMALAALGVVLFDFPLLTLWVSRPTALFVAWALFVATLAALLETAGSGSHPGEPADPGPADPGPADPEPASPEPASPGPADRGPADRGPD